MGDRIGGGDATPHQFYDVAGTSGSSGREVEWDPKDWNWDGDRFVATPVNPGCRNKQVVEAPASRVFDLNLPSSSGVVGVGVEGDEEDAVLEAGCLDLNLGQDTSTWDARRVANYDGHDGKGSDVRMGSSRSGACQVEGCGVDLSGAKEYHRRHKVCETHTKSSTVLVRDVVQRFCQQCSRFHHLQEFDEGKRSCRRRLAGHNKRRRKNHHEISFAYNNEDATNQQLLFDLLRSLVNLVGSVDTRKLSAVLRACQELLNMMSSCGGTLIRESQNINCDIAHESSRSHIPDAVQDHIASTGDRVLCASASVFEIPNNIEVPQCSPEPIFERAEPTFEKSGIRNFDLNDVYSDQICELEDAANVDDLKIPGNENVNHPWLLSQGPYWTNGVSNSAPESFIRSNKERQGRTDKIVFKLFDKDPSDFPTHLRNQIFNWLSCTPTDAESFIRPGCVILTIYLRLSESIWEEFSCNLSFHLTRLLDLAHDEFWGNGWFYVRVQHHMALVYNGQLVLDAPSPENHNCKILSVSPLAVTISGEATFRVKGPNFVGSAIRLLCAFEGKYLVEKATYSLLDESTAGVHEQHQFLELSCSIPGTSGRGFIEVEDCGLGSSYFPFIVAEEDICSEVCCLEDTIDVDFSENQCQEKLKAKEDALEFLHEMGWLLRNCQLESDKTNVDSSKNSFPLARFIWLTKFAIEWEWQAVVTKLLQIFFAGSIDTGSHSVDSALKEMALLHVAVERNSRTMVELLLRYAPGKSPAKTISQNLQGVVPGRFYFSPDMTNQHNVTPLHIAASRDNAEDVLDSLTSDPRQVGITTWKTARDSSGSTPEDCAFSSGHEPYRKLVDKKISGRSNVDHVALQIPKAMIGPEFGTQKQTDCPSTGEQMMPLRRDKKDSRRDAQSRCRMCSERQLAYGIMNRSSLLCRPAVVSMVCIATVCVCVGLLFKGPPAVRGILGPFRWDALGYGWM